MPRPRRIRNRKFTRSQTMARVRSRNTGVELRLRKALWAAGIRYRIQFKVPGTPDLAFPRARFALFIDGCFWHGCPKHYYLPATNKRFWKAKLNRNRSRDARVDAALREMGWRVLRLWEHQVEADVTAVTHRVISILRKRTGLTQRRRAATPGRSKVRTERALRRLQP